jgi:hypothetical protein
MHEYLLNLHMHTTYSDGTGTHADIVQAAIRAGLDAVIVTDHNVHVSNLEGYHGEGDQRVLVLVGEEVHDQARDPQKNHLLIFGAGRELAHLASDPQLLIDGANQAGGLAFLAHPIDPAAPVFGESDLSWVNWEVRNFTGIELWNSMTEFKSHLTSKLNAIYYAFNFKQVAQGPFPETIKKWDELLAEGSPVVAIGGSDAHMLVGKMGPVSKLLFPYEWHFKAINTHVLTPEPLNGELAHDRKLILSALESGHCFIGYDLPAPTQGFHFTAHCQNGVSWMGDTISAKESATLQIKIPRAAECHLLKDGESILASNRREAMVHKVTDPGVYRVEAYLRYKGKRRAWIFSNPIYVK